MLEFVTSYVIFGLITYFFGLVKVNQRQEDKKQFSANIYSAALIVFGILPVAGFLIYATYNILHYPYDYFVARKLDSDGHFFFATQHARSLSIMMAGAGLGVLTGIWLSMLAGLPARWLQDGSVAWDRHRRFGYAIMVIAVFLAAAFTPASLVGLIARNFTAIEFPGGKIEFRNTDLGGGPNFTIRREDATLNNEYTRRERQTRHRTFIVAMYTLSQNYLASRTKGEYLNADVYRVDIEAERRKAKQKREEYYADPIYILMRKVLIPLINCGQISWRDNVQTDDAGRFRVFLDIFKYDERETSNRVVKATNLADRLHLTKYIDNVLGNTVKTLLQHFEEVYSMTGSGHTAALYCRTLLGAVLDFESEPEGQATKQIVKHYEAWNSLSAKEKENSIKLFVSSTKTTVDLAIGAFRDPENVAWRDLSYAIMLYYYEEPNAKSVFQKLMANLQYNDSGKRHFDRHEIFQIDTVHEVIKRIYYSGETEDWHSYLQITRFKISVMSDLLGSELENVMDRFSSENTANCYTSETFRYYFMGNIGAMNNYIYRLMDNEALWDLKAEASGERTFMDVAELYADRLREINFSCLWNLPLSVERRRELKEKVFRGLQIPVLDTLLRFELLKISLADLRRDIVRDHHRVELRELFEKYRLPLRNRLREIEVQLTDAPLKVAEKPSELVGDRNRIKDVIKKVVDALDRLEAS